MKRIFVLFLIIFVAFCNWASADDYELSGKARFTGVAGADAPFKVLSYENGVSKIQLPVSEDQPGYPESLKNFEVFYSVRAFYGSGSDQTFSQYEVVKAEKVKVAKDEKGRDVLIAEMKTPEDFLDSDKLWFRVFPKNYKNYKKGKEGSSLYIIPTDGHCRADDKGDIAYEYAVVKKKPRKIKRNTSIVWVDNPAGKQ